MQYHRLPTRVTKIGSGVLGAGSSKPSLPTGDGVVTPLRAPRTPEPLSMAEIRGRMPSPPEPVGWTELKAMAYSGSGAEPQELGASW